MSTRYTSSPDRPLVDKSTEYGTGIQSVTDGVADVPKTLVDRVAADPDNLRDALELGGAALLDVGTTTGHVAAADDSRITGALQALPSHAHGNITNAGLVGTTENLPLITGTGGLVQAGSFGTEANTFCAGDDARVIAGGTALQDLTGALVTAGTVIGATLQAQEFTSGVSAGGVTLTEVTVEQLCQDPLCDDAAKWALGTGWAVAGGLAGHTAGVGALVPYPDIVAVIGTVYKIQLDFTALATGGVMTMIFGGVTTTVTLVALETGMRTYYVKATATTGLSIAMATAVRCSITFISVNPIVSGGERVTGLVEYASGTSHLYADAAAKDAHRTAMGVGTGDAVTLASLTTTGNVNASGAFAAVRTDTGGLSFYYTDRATSAPYEAWQSVNGQTSSSGTPVRCPGGFRFSGTAWNTNGAGASKANAIQYEFIPVSGDPSSGIYRVRNVMVDGTTNTTTLFSCSTSGAFSIPGTLGVTGAATITGLTTCNGGIKRAYVAKTSAYVIGANDDVIDYTSGTFVVTLPTAESVAGREYTVKNSGTGVITVNTIPPQTIDGETTQTLNQWESMTVISNGAGWIII